MHERQQDITKSYERAVEFAKAHTPEGAPAYWVQDVDDLADVIQSADAQAAAQKAHDAGGKAAAKRKTAGVKRLRVIMSSYRDLSRTLADDHPGLDALFVVPSKDVGVTSLLGDARAFVQHATKHSALFAPILGDDHVEKLKKAIQVVEVASSDQITEARLLKAATEGLPVTLERGRRCILLIGTHVQRHYGTEEVVVKAWQRAIRIGRKKSPAALAAAQAKAALPRGRKVRVIARIATPLALPAGDPDWITLPTAAPRTKAEAELASDSHQENRGSKSA